MDPTQTTRGIFVPLNHGTTVTTTSTTYTALTNSEVHLGADKMFDSQFAYARLVVRATNDTGGESVFFRLRNRTDGVAVNATETEIAISTGGNWISKMGPEARLAETADGTTPLTRYALQWKVTGGTGEMASGAAVGVYLYV